MAISITHIYALFSIAGYPKHTHNTNLKDLRSREMDPTEELAQPLMVSLDNSPTHHLLPPYPPFLSHPWCLRRFSNRSTEPELLRQPVWPEARNQLLDKPSFHCQKGSTGNAILLRLSWHLIPRRTVRGGIHWGQPSTWGPSRWNISWQQRWCWPGWCSHRSSSLLLICGMQLERLDACAWSPLLQHWGKAGSVRRPRRPHGLCRRLDRSLLAVFAWFLGGWSVPIASILLFTRMNRFRLWRYPKRINKSFVIINKLKNPQLILNNLEWKSIVFEVSFTSKRKEKQYWKNSKNIWFVFETWCMRQKILLKFWKQKKGFSEGP